MTVDQFVLFAIIMTGTAVGQLSTTQCPSTAYNKKNSYFVIPNSASNQQQGGMSQSFQLNLQVRFESLPKPMSVFRLVTGSGVESVKFFSEKNGGTQAGKSETKYVIDRKGNLSQNFRSLILDEWDTIKPINMNVTIKDSNDFTVAWLFFKVDKTDSLISWFKKENLMSSFPWDMKNFLKNNYNYFSIQGDVMPSLKRYFLINLSYGGCPGDFGVFCVFDIEDPCIYGKSKCGYPFIKYAINNRAAGNWTEKGIAAKSMEIMATYDEMVFFYS